MLSLQKPVGRHSTLPLSAVAFQPRGNTQQVLLGPSRCQVSSGSLVTTRQTRSQAPWVPEDSEGQNRSQETADNLCGRACSDVAGSETPMDCSPPGSSVHGISRQEDWSGLPCPPPGESSRPGHQTHISCIGGHILYWCAIRGPQWQIPSCY